MVELLRPVTGEPTAIFERAAGSVEIHDTHPREVAIISAEVPPAELPKTIGEAMCEIEAHLTEAGVEIAGPPFVRYLGFGPGPLKAEIGFPVLRPAPHVGRMYPGRLPGGRVASIVHIGPYETLEQTYGKLQAWLAEAGIQGTGPMWEVYWSDPEAEPDPATWRTEILLPLD